MLSFNRLFLSFLFSFLILSTFSSCFFLLSKLSLSVCFVAVFSCLYLSSFVSFRSLPLNVLSFPPIFFSFPSFTAQLFYFSSSSSVVFVFLLRFIVVFLQHSIRLLLFLCLCSYIPSFRSPFPSLLCHFFLLCFISFFFVFLSP